MARLLLIDMGAVWGGQEVYSARLGELLSARGWRITRLSGLAQHVEEASPSMRIPVKYLAFPQIARSIVGLQNEHDLIHFNGMRAIYLSSIARLRKPCVGTKHAPYGAVEGHGVRHRMARLAGAFAFRRLDALIAVSAGVREELPARVAARTHVILNGVPDHGAAGRRAAAPGVLRLCFVGRLVEQKGIRRLLEACALLQRSGVPFTLQVAGSGPLQEEMSRRIEAAGLAAHVRLLGQVADPAEVYRSSDVCALPSLHEGLPLSLLEALSTGCALLGHAIPGVAEVIRDGHNGVLCGASAADIAGALQRLAAEPARLAAMQRQARQDYEQRWRLERMVDETEQLYLSLLGKAHA